MGTRLTVSTPSRICRYALRWCMVAGDLLIRAYGAWASTHSKALTCGLGVTYLDSIEP